MRKRNTLTIITSFTLLSLLIFLLVFHYAVIFLSGILLSVQGPSYDPSFTRHSTTSSEKKALTVAESFDYSKVFNVSGVTGRYPDLSIHFINNDSLNNINSLFEQKKFLFHDSFNYTAWVNDYETLEIHKNTSSISFFSSKNNSSYDNRGYNSFAFFTFNSTTKRWAKVDNVFSTNYKTSGIIVSMRLDIKTPTVISQTNQILVIDSNFIIKNIISFGQYAIS